MPNLFIIILVIIALFLFYKIKTVADGFLRVRNFYKYSFSVYKRFVDTNRYHMVEHTLKTEDGYNITLVHLYSKEKRNLNKKPIFMQHGLGSCAGSWLIGGPQNAPALILADQGHDIYLGNNRGTAFSCTHEKFRPSQKKFWDFSFEDFKYDLKAFFEFVVQKTQKKIYYVSLSQGSTQMLAALADEDEKELSEYIQDNLEKFYCFAPVVYSVR